MQRVPRRFVRQASSPQRISDVLNEGLADRAGEQIQLSERGFAWYTHHNLTLPAVPRDTETVEQAPLPPIDYAPLGVLPVPGENGEAPRPPVPVSLPADWHTRIGGDSEESIEDAYAMAADAADRASRSTARDLADLAAGPDHAYWTHQYPLAQYDENAAAALEDLTDPVTHGYTTQAVLHLRAALEEAGKKAADHYVQNVRNPQWKTAKGVQADDVHSDQARGIVITYLLAVREHAEEHGLDADAIVNVLEDAAGWTGELRKLGNKEIKVPHLPAAESIAEAAQHVANALREYALGETDTVDTLADRRKTWRAVEPRPFPAVRDAAEEHDQEVAGGAQTDGEAPPAPATVRSDQARPTAETTAPAPEQVEEGAALDQLAAGPEASDADDVGAQVMPSANDGTAAGAGASAQTAADDSTHTRQAERQDPAQEQAVRHQPGTGEQTLEQPPEARTGQVRPEAPLAPAPAPAIEVGTAPVPPTLEGPATAMPAPTDITPAVPGPVPEERAPEDGPDSTASLAETAPAPTGADEEPGTEPDAPAMEAASTAAPGGQLESSTPESENRPSRPPAAVREEGTMGTSAPPSAAAAEEPAAPDHTVAPAAPFDLESAAPYPDPAAYAVAHEALLTELNQHKQWLARTPAAQEAATALTDASTLRPPGLTALLALQDALDPGTDGGNQPTHLVQQLGHHIRCAQLTMAKFVLGQAEGSTNTARLRELRQLAFQGRFIAFPQQTVDGEMELGQYLQHRDEQVTQQSVGTQDPAEQAPETAEEATTMAVDPDDDDQLPIFELPGEGGIMTAQEAALRLLAQAQAHLADGNPDVSPLAHIHGNPVYARVDQAGTSAPVLLLGLASKDEGGSARAVTIPGDALAVVAPETLLTAVTAWMNASDNGARPLLDYAPSAPAPPPGLPAPDRNQPTPTETVEPGPATATAATTAAPSATGPQNSQGLAELPAPAAPATVTAPEPAAQPTTNAAATPPARETPAAPDADAAEEPRQTAAPLSAGSSSPQADSAAVPDGDQRQEQGSAQQEESAPAAPTQRPTPAQADPVDQLTALARSALTDLGITLEATGVLTANRTVVITLETSGNVDRDREIANSLRPALHQAIREHPDQGLAAYRIDFQHTTQPGQGSLHDAPSAQPAPVPRERLIAANNAAAKIFAERLRSDPNAELSRTYLAQERQLPAEVQQEWGLGYAPSDRGAGRWDLLVRELTAQGFTKDELLKAGLARQSKRGTLIDYFDDRIMFPIHDANADIVGFSGRRVDRPGETEEEADQRQSPKYLNTPDTALFHKGDHVFGLYHPAQAEALAWSNGPRVSVEGYTDVIALARAAKTVPIARRPVAGAFMGTALTERQLTALRALDTDNPRPHILFQDNDSSGRRVLLNKYELLLHPTDPPTVTTSPDAKDAAKLWEEGTKATGDGVTPVLRALEQRQPLLDAAVEAVLIKNADERERADHAFDTSTIEGFLRTRTIAAKVARYIRQSVQLQSPGDTSALEQAAVTWAKRLHQAWKIPGPLAATAVLLGPGNHDPDYEGEVYQHALDLLAADPDGYFADDITVLTRGSAFSADTDTPQTPPKPPGAVAPGPTDSAPAATAPGRWPAGTRASGPVTPTGTAAPARGELALSMFLPSPVDGQPVEHTDRTTAADALRTAVHERLGQHSAESPEPDRLPQPLKLGTIHGVDLSTSGDDQTGEDPTVVVWLGPSRSDSLRLSYSRLAEMTGPELLAAIEWRAAQAPGLLGTPLSQTWRDAVRSILPPQFPAQPTPAQLADLLDTIAQSPDSSEERIRHRAEQAIDLYTTGHADRALTHLAANDHIWVLRNDGSWIQEEANGTELTWDELDNGFSQEAAELDDIAQAAAELPPGDPVPIPVDLTVAHHSAHEALAVLRPYSIGLPNTIYEKITDLVAQMDAGEPALRRLRGPDGKQLMNRAKSCFVRALEGLATVAAKIRLTGLSTRLERTVARLRGQDPAILPVERAVRTDRRMQDLAHIERDLERRMAAPIVKTPIEERVAARLAEEPGADPERELQIWKEERGRELDERGKLQEQWIINRARWRARYEQLTGLPPESEFLPDNGLVAGAPPVPNLVVAHDLLLDRLDRRVAELRDTDPHTGEESNPYDPTADLLNGVAWAYQQRLIGTVPLGADPQGPIPPAQLRQAALTVTSHRNASPLTLRRSMNVTAERADRLLHRLEEQQILGPYRADAPRTVLARPSDIDILLARPATPPALRKPATEPAPAPAAPSPAPDGADPGELDEALIHKMVSKILAEQQKRNGPRGEPDPADNAAPASRLRKNLRKSHPEAEANALAAGQPTSLAPSQT
ncbi:toprim domain-containing protein [Streptomyces botrytidirepellens]|nr:toprim domain-containing protein [Streptomyces botrytidirepellens]